MSGETTNSAGSHENSDGADPTRRTPLSATEAGGGSSEHESTANAMWSRLLAGNRRFAQGQPEHPWQDPATRESLIDAQHPDAAVLSCGDSRVPPEIIFDQGLGDMFVVRTAGEVLDSAVVSSLEFAVDTLHTSLVVVLGHEHCGTIQSAVAALSPLDEERLDELDRLVTDSPSPIIRSVGGSVLESRRAGLDDTDDFERVHIARTIERLVTESESISAALGEGRLRIVGHDTACLMAWWRCCRSSPCRHPRACEYRNPRMLRGIPVPSPCVSPAWPTCLTCAAPRTPRHPAHDLAALRHIPFTRIRHDFRTSEQAI